MNYTLYKWNESDFGFAAINKLHNLVQKFSNKSLIKLTDKIKNFHKTKSLTFTQLSFEQFESILEDGCVREIYTSNSGSVYFVAKILNKRFYIRLSHHWGKFSTLNTGDHEWKLINDKKDNSNCDLPQIGYVEIK